MQIFSVTMKEYYFDSLKYWKEPAVYSGTIAFLYLLWYIALSMFREALSYTSFREALLYTSAVTDSIRRFLMSPEIILGFLHTVHYFWHTSCSRKKERCYHGPDLIYNYCFNNDY